MRATVENGSMANEVVVVQLKSKPPLYCNAFESREAAERYLADWDARWELAIQSLTDPFSIHDYMRHDTSAQIAARRAFARHQGSRLQPKEKLLTCQAGLVGEAEHRPSPPSSWLFCLEDPSPETPRCPSCKTPFVSIVVNLTAGAGKPRFVRVLKCPNWEHCEPTDAQPIELGGYEGRPGFYIPPAPVEDYPNDWIYGAEDPTLAYAYSCSGWKVGGYPFWANTPEPNRVKCPCGGGSKFEFQIRDHPILKEALMDGGIIQVFSCPSCRKLIVNEQYF